MHHDITPQQAREQLAEAETTTDRSDDRRVHALATAGFGIAIGAYLALSRLAEETSWEFVLIGFYVVVLLGLARWQTRSARTWPRHARRTSRIGLAGTFVLFLAAIIGFNVVEAQQEADGLVPTDNIALLAGAGLVVALPLLVAALVIRRGEQR